MRCPSYGFANVEGMNFCGRCGAKLPRMCQVCGVPNPSEHLFCGRCGTRLADITPSPDPVQPTLRHDVQEERSRVAALPAAGCGEPEAERRQLTVLFCALVDSTVLAGQMDPEDLRKAIRAYQTTCAEVIQRFDGHIAQYCGDGLLVYLGYPQAHEDDAQRAVRAGLEVIAAMRQLNGPGASLRVLHMRRTISD